MDSLKRKAFIAYPSNLQPLSYIYLYSRIIIAVEFLTHKRVLTDIMSKPHASTCGESNKTIKELTPYKE